MWSLCFLLREYIPSNLRRRKLYASQTALNQHDDIFIQSKVPHDPSFLQVPELVQLLRHRNYLISHLPLNYWSAWNREKRQRRILALDKRRCISVIRLKRKSKPTTIDIESTKTTDRQQPSIAAIYLTDHRCSIAEKPLSRSHFCWA